MTAAAVLNTLVGAVQGLTALGAKAAMLSAAQELCESAGVWSTEETFSTTAGVNTYTLSPPDGAIVVMVDRVFRDGWLIRPLTEHGAPEEDIKRTFNYDYDTGSVVMNGDVVAGTDNLVVRYWISPVSFDDIPPVVSVANRRGLEEGAKAALYYQPNRPYSSPGLAQVHRRRFNGLINTARRNALSSNSAYEVGFEFHPFAPRSQHGRRRR